MNKKCALSTRMPRQETSMDIASAAKNFAKTTRRKLDAPARAGHTNQFTPIIKFKNQIFFNRWNQKSITEYTLQLRFTWFSFCAWRWEQKHHKSANTSFSIHSSERSTIWENTAMLNETKRFYIAPDLFESDMRAALQSGDIERIVTHIRRGRFIDLAAKRRRKLGKCSIINWFHIRAV